MKSNLSDAIIKRTPDPYLNVVSIVGINAAAVRTETNGQAGRQPGSQQANAQPEQVVRLFVFSFIFDQIEDWLVGWPTRQSVSQLVKVFSCRKCK